MIFKLRIRARDTQGLATTAMPVSCMARRPRQKPGGLLSEPVCKQAEPGAARPEGERPHNERKQN